MPERAQATKVRGELDRWRCKAATHDEAAYRFECVLSPSRLQIKRTPSLEDLASATVSDGCAGEPTRSRAYSGFLAMINRFTS